MKFTRPQDFDTEGFSDGEAEEASQPQCSRCKQYMARGTTMVQCRECQEYFAKREEYLQRWGLRPKGVNIEVKARREAA